MDSALNLPNFSSLDLEPISKSSPKYRKYPDAVKQEVSRTKNIYLFPDLKIPRTTAQYWVKRQRNFRASNVVEIDSIFKKKSEFLEAELAKERAIRKLLETVRKVFPYDFRTRLLKNKQSRAQIIAAIQECLKFQKLQPCLDAIGLTKSAYRRWLSEIHQCNKSKSACDRRQAGQLTEDEIGNMKKFVISRKYAHVSISSLHLLAQRSGELFCSIATWYKYIKLFEWKRPWLKVKKDYKKIGIRSSRPNEIWHIDVTEVSAGPHLKFYIQAVIDNFSRFILAWTVTDTIDAKTTVETLAKARQKVDVILNTYPVANVMMDPGKENRNEQVQKYIISKNLKRVIAQTDIHYSNSMIEGLFHGLKNRYLYHQKIKSIEDLERKAKFYFKQHNEVIPLNVLNGGRPLEVFKSSWGEVQRNELQLNKERAFQIRKQKNLEPPCAACPC